MYKKGHGRSWCCEISEIISSDDNKYKYINTCVEDFNSFECYTTQKTYIGTIYLRNKFISEISLNIIKEIDHHLNTCMIIQRLWTCI